MSFSFLPKMSEKPVKPTIEPFDEFFVVLQSTSCTQGYHGQPNWVEVGAVGFSKAKWVIAPLCSPVSFQTTLRFHVF